MYIHAQSMSSGRFYKPRMPLLLFSFALLAQYIHTYIHTYIVYTCIRCVLTKRGLEHQHRLGWVVDWGKHSCNTDSFPGKESFVLQEETEECY